MVVELSRLATPGAGPIFPLVAMLFLAETRAAVGRRAVEERSLLVAWTAGQAMFPLSATMQAGVEGRTAVAEEGAGVATRAAEAAPAELTRIRNRIRSSPGTP
jgi:hypothetical protein